MRSHATLRKTALRSNQTLVKFLDSFWPNVGSHLRSKSRTNKPRGNPKSTPERAKIAKACFLRKRVFCVAVYNTFGPPGFPRKTRESQECPKRDPENLQEAIGKTCLTLFLPQAHPSIASEMANNHYKKWFEKGPK